MVSWPFEIFWHCFCFALVFLVHRLMLRATGLPRLDLSRGFFNAGDLAEWGGIATSYVADFQIREWADKSFGCMAECTWA